ncbi:MAG: 4-hydroxy-tetrahydrodipicolinate synthase [Paenibacillus sp. RIFOXYA1_FULL_44_5]|nr:MAG: 4-hydroxy-tetrahydrodipicolinate synthase [Paenibacillus sp. RIFOXYA1_FULL_44_5]
MVTPFDDQQRINWDQVRKLIDYLIDEQQNDSLVICGTTGESPTLSDSEKLELFQVAVSHAAGRCKIIAGTGSNSTHHSIQLTREAEKIGVDGVLLVAPYYNRPNQAGLYEHFAAVAGSTQLPVMLYNIPSRTGVQIEYDTLLKLSQIPNIVATKESHSDFDLVAKLIANASSGFRVYSGDDTLTLPLMSVGGYGVVSVAAHVIGKEIKQMILSFVEGNVSEAARLHGELHPIFHGLFYCPHRVPNPAPVKYALNLHGMDVGSLRLPLLPVTEQEQRFIRELFA